MTFLRYIVLPVIYLLWWAGSAHALVDTVYVDSSDHSGSQWVGRPLDSIDGNSNPWRCVNEVSLNVSDSAYVAIAGRELWVTFVLDTADYEILDSVKWKINCRHELNADSLRINYDTNGTDVDDFDAVPITNGAARYESSAFLTTLSKRNLSDLEFAVEPWTTTFGNDYIVIHIFMEIHHSEAGAVSPRRRRLLLEASK